MIYVVLVDLRENNGHAVPIEDDNGNIKQFASREEIFELEKSHPLMKAFTWMAINMDTQEVEFDG